VLRRNAAHNSIIGRIIDAINSCLLDNGQGNFVEYYNMRTSTRNRGPGFSLIELTIVLAIMVVISAIALPRVSSASVAANDSALTQDLDVLRKALDAYAAEHLGTYPSVANFKKQLTAYTDEKGNYSASLSTTYIFAPYLLDIPSLPVGNGGSKVAVATAGGVGWIYDPTTGVIRANTTIEADARGVLYSSY
jgi:prepilin-type N-terminal cleavage/methylation domain-containing protein